MSYPGGKEGGRAYHTLISQIPPHRVYVEAFAGGAAVLRHKRPARSSIAIDADTGVLGALRTTAAHVPGLTLTLGDALEMLEQPTSLPPLSDSDTFVYVDPPYLAAVRSDPRRDYYACEFKSEAEHRRLLAALRRLPCMVMVSGYTHPLYELALAGWRTVTFGMVTRGGTVAEESVWLNYPEPFELHDARYVGADYRDRERIRRKQARWRRMLSGMPPHERYAMLASIAEFRESLTTQEPR